MFRTDATSTDWPETFDARFVPVTGRPFRARCLACGQNLTAGDGFEVYADTQGKPFEAYYCKPCFLRRGQPSSVLWLMVALQSCQELKDKGAMFGPISQLELEIADAAHTVQERALRFAIADLAAGYRVGIGASFVREVLNKVRPRVRK